MNKLQLTGGEVIPEGKAVVSLDANGGSLPEGTSTKRTLNKGDQAGELPTPTRNRHNFKGWFTQPEGGEKVTEETVVSDSIILYAQWENQPKQKTYLFTLWTVVQMLSQQKEKLIERITQIR